MGLYFIFILMLYFNNRSILMNEMVSFATEYGQIQRGLLRELDLPYGILDEDGRIIWTNAAFEKVIHKEKEPILPFAGRIRQLYQQHGVSTVLVAGSSGVFFHTADVVIQMDTYEPSDITERAKAAAAGYQTDAPEVAGEMSLSGSREPFGKRGGDRGHREDREERRYGGRPGGRYGGRGGEAGGPPRDRIKTRTNGTDSFSVDHEEVDLREVEQIVDEEQTAALCQALVHVTQHMADGKKTVRDLTEEVDMLLAREGLEGLLGKEPRSGLAMPRRYEIYAALSRYRRA